MPFGQGFVPWVDSVVAAEDPPEEARRACAAAIRFMEERGTVAVGDVANSLGHVDLLRASSLRAVVFLELLAWDPGRAEEALAWADEQLGAVEGGENVEVRLAAHAPHSVSRELFAGIAARGGPRSIHLAESPEEVRFLATGGGPWAAFLEGRGLGHVAFDPPEVSPVQYAGSLGLLGPETVAVHAVQLNDEDRQRLQRSGAAVVVCPRSNRNIGVGTADVPALLRTGVRLGLGTDSLASAQTLDVLDDAVALALEFPDVNPAALVRMATAGGAEALGLADLGTIAPGKRAALAYAPAESTPPEPFAHLVSGEARLQRVRIP